MVSCKKNEKNNSEKSTKTTEVVDRNENQSTNELNLLIDDPENEGEQMLLGRVDENGFKNKVHFPWMYEGFEAYKPNAIKLEKIKMLMGGVKLQVFMGTWCEDSQREIPRLYKILHTINYDLNNLTVVAVSHDKDTPEKLEENYNIEYVPTIIFMKDGKELNRIVEYTQGDTLEDDMLTILNGEDYTPAYSD